MDAALGLMQPAASIWMKSMKLVEETAVGMCIATEDREKGTYSFTVFVIAIFFGGLVAGLLVGWCLRGARLPAQEPEAEPSATAEADATAGAGGDVHHRLEGLLAEIRKLKMQTGSCSADPQPQQTSPDLPSRVFAARTGECYHTSDICRSIRLSTGVRSLRPCAICCLQPPG